MKKIFINEDEKSSIVDKYKKLGIIVKESKIELTYDRSNEVVTIDDTTVAPPEDTKGEKKSSEEKKGGEEKKNDSSKKSTGSYKYCADFPFVKFCSNKAVIGKVQECLGGLKTDGFFGPKTEAKLKEKGYEIEITKEVYDKIMADCGKETPKEEPKKEGEVDVNPYADWVSGEEESD